MKDPVVEKADQTLIDVTYKRLHGSTDDTAGSANHFDRSELFAAFNQHTSEHAGSSTTMNIGGVKSLIAPVAQSGNHSGEEKGPASAQHDIKHALTNQAPLPPRKHKG